ncbi:hypothetical protein HZA57_03460 [Candidatus Poribacteria bacterium]|nr:hypothetical protein [Candidatus Poribacteria bacterium]
MRKSSLQTERLLVDEAVETASRREFADKAPGILDNGLERGQINSGHGSTPEKGYPRIR